MKNYARILTAGLALLAAAPVASAQVLKVRDHRGAVRRPTVHVDLEIGTVRRRVPVPAHERRWRHGYPRIERLNARSAKPGRDVSLRIADYHRGVRIYLDDTRVQVVGLERDGDVVVRVPTDMAPGRYWFSVRRGRTYHRADKSFTIDPPAVIQGIPDRVPAGSIIALDGRYFDAGVRLFYGGVELRVVEVAPRRLLVALPRHAARRGYLVVDDGGIRSRFARPLRVTRRHRW